MYRITKLFVSGLLEGLTITEVVNYPVEAGFRCDKPCGGTSGYVILTVERI